MGKWWELTHPTEDIKIIAPQLGVKVLGEWDDSSGIRDMTWRQYTNYIAGNVLRQNEIAARLRKLGFARFTDEPYMSHSFDLDRYLLMLTGDELEALLNMAENNLS